MMAQNSKSSVLQDTKSEQLAFVFVNAADQKSPRTFTRLEDAWRPLKKRPLRMVDASESICMRVNSPHTLQDSEKDTAVDTSGKLQEVALCIETLGVAERRTVPKVGSGRLLRIDLDALTYYPPRPSSVRREIVVGTVSKQI